MKKRTGILIVSLITTAIIMIIYQILETYASVKIGFYTILFWCIYNTMLTQGLMD